MRPIYPWGAYNGYSYTGETGSNLAYTGQPTQSNTPPNVPDTPNPKEGDQSDNDKEDSVEEPPEVNDKKRKGESK